MVLRQIVVSVGALFVANPGPQTSGDRRRTCRFAQRWIRRVACRWRGRRCSERGLNDLLMQFQQTGQADVAKSWIGSGPNKAISPDDLANALGADRINDLMSYFGKIC